VTSPRACSNANSPDTLDNRRRVVRVRDDGVETETPMRHRGHSDDDSEHDAGAEVAQPSVRAVRSPAAVPRAKVVMTAAQ
jgi:hypothetical protein